jgi:hypothetical protein
MTSVHRACRNPGRPRDDKTALAIQDRVGELRGVDVGGWKCSLPTPDKVAFMAPIYAPTITSME